MNSSPQLSVAIPLHNEQSALPELLERLRAVLDVLPGGPHEIVFADDGSTDSTMFASPVAYASSLVPARWRWLYGLNPMAGVIDGFRWAITGRGQAPGLLLLASAGAVALVLLGGLFFFNRMESSVADRV